MGEVFDWKLTVACDFTDDACVDATVVDHIPSDFEITGGVTVDGVADVTSTVSGNTVTVVFAQALSTTQGAATGLRGTATISIPVRLVNLDYQDDGKVFVNEATATAANSAEATAEGQVTAAVDLSLKAGATKSYNPESNLALAGEQTTLTLTATNNSNSEVDTLTVQDPADPGAAPNPFQSPLRISGDPTVTWPAGATSAVYSVYDVSSGGWVAASPVDAPGALTAPAGVSPADIGGIRIVYSSTTGSIDRGASTTVAIDVVNTADAAGITVPTPFPNTVRATVGLDDETSPHADASKTYTLNPLRPAVSADKEFVDDELATVPYGSSDKTHTTANLTATNTGTTPLSSLTINEPENPADLTPANPFAPAHPGDGLLLSGIANSVTWPAGATGATITYYYADGSTSGPLATAMPDTVADNPRTPFDPASPVTADRLTGFSVTFTSTDGIEVSAAAKVPVEVQANPNQVAPGLKIVFDNTIGVIGKDIHDLVPTPATASDRVTVYADQVTITTSKKVAPTELLAVPGQTTTAQLSTNIAEYPETTRDVDYLEIVDPAAGTSDDWYNYFDVTQITLTPIPTNAKLSVQYQPCDGGSWTSLGAGFTDITYGSAAAPSGFFTKEIPAGLRDNVCGIKFIYEPVDPAEGFVPGQSLSPNVTYGLRSELRDGSSALPNEDLDGVLENCSQSQAASGTVESNVAKSECATVNLNEVGPGTDMLDKDFIESASSTGQNLINTRQDATTRVRLAWSTGGYTGVDSMVVSDTKVGADGKPVASTADSPFDAFDLVAVPAITAAQDPLIPYDQVYLELWNGAAWVQPSGGTGAGATCTAAAPCAGQFPGYTLSAAERASTTAVRLVYSERPGRSTVSPAPNSGVAASIPRNRQIFLTVQLRDTKRSAPSKPVLAGTTFNTAVQGDVDNDATAQAVENGAIVRTDNDADAITLKDADLGLSVDKAWAGGPVAIPDTTVPAADCPTTRVTLTAKNTTPARVSSLSVIDPDGNGSNAQPATPFDRFTLKGILSISVPTGATGVSIAFQGAPALDRTGAPATAISAVVAYTEVQLADVTGISVTFTGPIAAGASTAVAYDLRLRTTLRGTSTPVTVADLTNQARGTVADPRYQADGTTLADDSETGTDTADLKLVTTSFGVVADKTITPSSQSETQNPKVPVTLALSGTPSGSSRTTTMTLTDQVATFWNAFDFVAVGSSFSLPAFSPAVGAAVLRVYPEVCVTRTWNASAISATPALSCAAAGGTWKSPVADPGDVSTWLTATQAKAGILPSGVTAADVVGVRFTVKRLNGANWENPQAPKITVPITVLRRDTLRTGGPVPTTLNDGGSPAPGSTVKGALVNTVEVSSTSSTGATAQGSKNATYTFTHAPTSVQVEKLPVSGTSVAAGTAVPYQLKVTNTGQWPILNPVITDVLPSDAEGPQLQVVAGDSDGVPDFSFALTGSAPAPPSGPALPTTAANVTATTDTAGGGVTGIRFAFPAGSVLEVGQTYTISVPLAFRPGLVETDTVTNSFGVTGDRRFDTCTAPAGKPSAYDPATNTCSTQTTVKPAAAANIAAVKAVRPITDATYTEDLGFKPESSTDCAQARDANGFSVTPCVPRTLPGQTEEWRLTVQNTGTQPLSRVVVTDRLPVPGDKTLIAGLTRSSQWAAAFAGGTPVVATTAGATLKTYYTTSASPCLEVLKKPTNGTCASDPAAGWALWDPAGTVDPATVTALQFVIDYAPAANRLAPGKKLDVTFRTVTPETSPTAGKDTVAANSLSTSAVAVSGASTTTIAARDYSIAWVALATGDLTVRKVVTGPGAGFVPSGQVFAADLVCTSVGVELSPIPFTITAGETTTFTDLPGGASCTVSEPAASGQTSYTAPAQIVDVSSPSVLPSVVLTNTYELASLRVTKKVTSNAGTVPTAFGFTLSCTFLGQSVPLAATDAAFTLDDGDTKTVTGLPAGATCVVTETDNHAADSTITSGSSSTGSVTTDQATRTATITALSHTTTAETSDQVQFDNLYGVAGLRVEKFLDGPAAQQLGADQSYPISVVCTYDNATQSYQAVLNAGNGWAASWLDVIQGSECLITETSLQGASAVRISPNDGINVDQGAVIIPATGVAQVDVTNWFPAGSLEVTKTFVGNGATKFGTRTYTVELVCTLGGDPLTVTDGGVRTLSRTEPTTLYEHLPQGAECTLRETADGGATSSQIVDADTGDSLGDATTGHRFTVDAPGLQSIDQAQPALQVENTFLLTSVPVTKKIDSAATDATGRPLDYGPFLATLVCTLDGEPVTAAEDATQTLTAGTTTTWTELPVGALCRVEETSTAGASGTQIVVAAAPEAPVDATFSDLPALVESGADNKVTIVNRYDVAKVVVSKSVIGTGAAKARSKVFTVHVECVLTDDTRPAPGAVVWSKDYRIGGPKKLTAAIDTLAAGAHCVITETATGQATSTRIFIGSTSTSGPSATFVAAAGVNPLEVTVENTFTVVPPKKDPDGKGGEDPRAGERGPGGRLAQTGASVVLWMQLGSLLAAGGFLLVMAARRRRED